MLWQRRETHGSHSVLSSTVGTGWPQLEAEAQVKELKEELWLEKDMQLSTTMLASGLANKVGEQDNKDLTMLFCKARSPGTLISILSPVVGQGFPIHY